MSFELLEDRRLLAIGVGFDGINHQTMSDFVVPDPIGAAGPHSFIQAVNSALIVLDKSTGGVIPGGEETSFISFFSQSLLFDVGMHLFDPVIVYNDNTQRFGVGVVDTHLNAIGNSVDSRFNFAISRSNNPTLALEDWDFFQYDTDDDPSQEFFNLGDYPKIGYNADGFVVSFNMFIGDSSQENHVAILGIGNDGSSSGMRTISNGTITYAPASQHGSVPGDGIWFVRNGQDGDLGSDIITVVRLNNPFDSGSMILKEFDLTVTAYQSVPIYARQLDSSPGLAVGRFGNRFYFSALRTVGEDIHLVSAHTVGVPLDPLGPIELSNTAFAVRWYDIVVTNGTVESEGNDATAELSQEGTVNPAPLTTDTYMPSINIAPDGTIGLNYLQSGVSQYLAMYVTANRPSDDAGTMRTPQLVKQSDVKLNTSLSKVGDYSFTSVDPIDGSFWAVNEYAIDSPAPNWGTWIQQFDYTPPKVTGVIVSSSIANQAYHPPYDFRTATYDDSDPGTDPDPKVIGTGFQLRTVPVAAADTLEIVFSEYLPNHGRDQLRVVGLNSGVTLDVAAADYFYDELTNTAKWKFPSWTANDNYAIILDDALMDNTSNALDGEWINPGRLFDPGTANPYSDPSISTFPSGDGIPGGTFAFIVTLLGGDADLNNLVAVANDGFIVVANTGGTGLTFVQGDFDGDGMVTVSPDGFIFVANQGLNRQIIVLLGDVTGDGIVDGDDIVELDDINGDGFTNSADLAIVLSQFGIQIVA